MKKFLAMLVTIASIFWLASCGNTDNPENQTGTELLDMERDYVYMWNQSGVGGADKIMKVQTEKYALTADAKSGAITAIGAYVSSVKDKYSRADFNTLLEVSSMKYSVGFDGGEITFNRQLGYQRVIESGRYLQRADYNCLQNTQDTRWTGRMEIAATKNYVAINYEVHNGSETRQSLDLSFTMQFKGDLVATDVPSGRGLTIRSADGQGITVLRAIDDDLTRITFSDETLYVSRGSVEVNSGAFGGFGVLFIPSSDATPDDASVVYAVEDCEVTAECIYETATVPVNFDSRRGIYTVDISEVNGVSQSTQTGRNTYDRVGFSVKNNGNTETVVPISFQKYNNVSVTGLSPMIRDAETLEPTGIQVQISKNWHTNPNSNVSQTAPARYLEGRWYHGTTCIPTKGNETVSYEYTCAYGEWGGVYAASHAQLCLIGWGGANNLLWEESAMGSWGESVTYDPDMGLGRSMIDDVRPFLVVTDNFGSQQFNWTGNVGGANFLDYYPTAKQSKLVDLIPTYYTQGPNLTHVTYDGITADGSIAANITINMGRTDDVVRTYYTLKYTFLKDTKPERLSFFKLCADGYADNNFRKYAIGDKNGVLVNDALARSVSMGYNGDAVQAADEDFWFKLYDSSNFNEENGDVSFIVRDYKAKLNGKVYDKPSYRLFGTYDSVAQPSCELSLPSGLTEIKAGSAVEMKIEYLVLPGNESSYYGQSDYLIEGKLFGTSAATFDQVLGGKTVANVSVGNLQSTYPISIGSISGDVVAQFTLTGGLGYVPVRITNVSDYKGYRLQKNVSGSWQDVVQVGSSKNQNDYWQVRYDPGSKSYEFIFNIKNTEGLDYGATNEYRLILL